MKYWLIYPYTTPRDNNAFGWFREAFRRHGMDLEVYFWGVDGVPKSALISENGEVVPLDKRDMPNGAIIRGYNSGLSMWFEIHHKRVVNRCKAMEFSRDKVLTARMLEAAGITTPRTLTYGGRGGQGASIEQAESATLTAEYGCGAELGRSAADFLSGAFPSYGELLCDFRGRPFVMKLTFGSKGEDVYLVENEEQYITAVESCSRTCKERLALFEARGGMWTENGAWRGEVLHGCEPLFQEYIAASRGKDLRVWVIGGKVAGHLLRHSSTSFKSNFARGGNADLCDLPLEAAELAISATKCLGLDFAGVDLLFLEQCENPADCHRFTVCEVNGNAGFRTASLVGGADIPDALASALGDT